MDQEIKKVLKAMTKFIEASAETAEATQAQISKLESKIQLLEATMASFFSTVCDVSPQVREGLLQTIDAVLDEFVGEEPASTLAVPHLHFLRGFISGGPTTKPYLKALQGGKDKDKSNDQ